jgi:hypothetical protein
MTHSMPRDIPAPHVGLVGFDIEAAVHMARDQKNIKETYQKVFGTTEGRAVLIDMLVRGNLLLPRLGSMTLQERAQLDGHSAMVLETLGLAGVDVYEIGAALLSAAAVNQRMERAHERSDEHGDDDHGTDILDDAGGGDGLD